MADAINQFSDPVFLKNLATAFLLGLVPALLWLWFWLREDREHPEPLGLIVITFILGALSVMLVLPLEKFANSLLDDKNMLIVIWASIEEVAKYLAVGLIALRSKELNEPIDYPIYFIATALGFAALENTLFLMHPLAAADTTTSLITGNLRFLGATLLHATSSALVGISLGLSYFNGWFSKKIHLVFGLAAAITLHSVFNFFIMKDNGENFLNVFGFLWVVTIMIMLLFEKLKRMSRQ
ncbi:MAG: PrsW family glutamic-type intramembrane protease [Candidatus Paceibacterota bacterium]|jgi:RsiW-degrading membrane proteinase PrsW (M82 family)